MSPQAVGLNSGAAMAYEAGQKRLRDMTKAQLIEVINRANTVHANHLAQILRLERILDALVECSPEDKTRLCPQCIRWMHEEYRKHTSGGLPF